MGDTSISWTDKTWNPIRGCRRVSAGCERCYAERQANRFAGVGGSYEGLIKLTKNGPRWTGETKFVREHLADPLRWKKPLRIFVDSMSDLFYEGFTNEQIAAVFGVMAAASQHTFQVLTKRAKRMRAWFEWARERAFEDGESVHDYGLMLAGFAGTELGDGSSADECDQIGRIQDLIADAYARTGDDGGTVLDCPWPLPNVWLGVSVENQEAADERIPDLLATPAAIRFLSCEPLLGPVDLGRFLRCPECGYTPRDVAEHLDHRLCRGPGPRLSWVIAGAESGPRARECRVEWLRSLMEQCAAAGVARFLKQAVDTWTPDTGVVEPTGIYRGEGSRAKGRGFGGPVIELPYLDGVQHAEFPR